MENSMERHRRFKEQRGEIVNFAKAFGPLAAMEKFDIRTFGAVNRILNKGGANAIPIVVDRRALYPNSESLFDGLVKRIAGTISGLLAKVEELQQRVAWQDERIKELRGQLASSRAASTDHEETVLVEVELLCQKAEEQIGDAK